MYSPVTNNANEIIAALQAGQYAVLEQLYDLHRRAFLSWATQRFRTTPNDIEDAWQEAVVVFFEQVRAKKLMTLRCSVRTYLFAIGYKHLLKTHRKLKIFIWKDEVDKALLLTPEYFETAEEDIWEHERAILLAAMQGLSPNCQKILAERHFTGLSIPEILAASQYKSTNTVYVTLANCLARLKQIIEEKTQS